MLQRFRIFLDGARDLVLVTWNYSPAFWPVLLALIILPVGPSLTALAGGGQGSQETRIVRLEIQQSENSSQLQIVGADTRELHAEIASLESEMRAFMAASKEHQKRVDSRLDGIESWLSRIGWSVCAGLGLFIVQMSLAAFKMKSLKEAGGNGC